MARMKFLCDAERCIECNACVTACKNEHEVPWGVNRRRVVVLDDGMPGLFSIQPTDGTVDSDDRQPRRERRAVPQLLVSARLLADARDDHDGTLRFPHWRRPSNRPSCGRWRLGAAPTAAGQAGGRALGTTWRGS